MSNESSSRPLGGVSGVCTPQGCLYEHSPVGCKSPSEVVSTPETKASHHQLLGCPWLQSQLAVGKGKKKGASAPPVSPHPHTFQPSLIATLQNCRTNKYFLQELKRVSKKKKMVSKLTVHIWLADLIAQSFSTQTSRQICPGGSSWLIAFAF